MFTPTEKTSLALTVSFLLVGAGLKTWQRHQVRLGPFQDQEESALGAANPSSPVPGDSLAAGAGSPLGPAGGPAAGSAGAETHGRPHPAIRSDLPLAGADGEEGPGNRISAASSAPDDPPRRKRGKAGSRDAGKKAPPAGKVSLNRASAAELAEIPGIGAKTALAILAYRKSHGEFLDLKELVHVKGIGEKKLERIAPFLAISPERAEEPVRQALLPAGGDPE